MSSLFWTIFYATVASSLFVTLILSFIGELQVRREFRKQDDFFEEFEEELEDALGLNR
jgi:hypothetical protein